MRFGVQVFGAMAANTINYQADILLIGYFLTATDVGYYAVAVSLSRFFWLIPDSIHRITYPATSDYWAKNNHTALNKMIDKSMKYTTCILLLFGLGVGFFAKEIITTIFGNEFIRAVLPLQILIIGTVIFGIFKAVGGALGGIERVDLILKIAGLGALVNIILNISLIPLFGILGAAIATITSFSFVSILSLNFICKLIEVKIDTRWYAKIAALISILIFSAFMASSSANQHLLYLILLCIYGLLIIKFLLTKEDKEYFRTMLSSFFSSKSN
jgi:O-antigen/teichoic acid export membrane protein